MESTERPTSPSCNMHVAKCLDGDIEECSRVEQENVPFT